MAYLAPGRGEYFHLFEYNHIGIVLEFQYFFGKVLTFGKKILVNSRNLWEFFPKFWKTFDTVTEFDSLRIILKKVVRMILCGRLLAKKSKGKKFEIWENF